MEHKQQVIEDKNNIIKLLMKKHNQLMKNVLLIIQMNHGNAILHNIFYNTLMYLYFLCNPYMILLVYQIFFIFIMLGIILLQDVIRRRELVLKQ